MPDYTTRGVPFALGTDPNDLTLHTQGLAEWVDAHPGLSPLTTPQRDALTGAELWEGRVILNLTTTKLERYDAAAEVWRSGSVADHGELTGLADDDHPQYLTTGRHDTPARHGSSVVDHGSIGGLADDDHPQYAKTDGSRGAFAAPVHTHDDRYYTEAEINGLGFGRVATGTYTGDETFDRTIALPFSPKFVVITRTTIAMYFSNINVGTLGARVEGSSIAQTEASGNSYRPLLTAGGFIVSKSASGNNLNSNFQAYQYVAIG